MVVVEVVVVVDPVEEAEDPLLVLGCPKTSLNSVTWLLDAALATAAAEGEPTVTLLLLLDMLLPLLVALPLITVGLTDPSTLTMMICSSRLPPSSVATTDSMYCPAWTPCTAMRRLPLRARPVGSCPMLMWYSRPAGVQVKR